MELVANLNDTFLYLNFSDEEQTHDSPRSSLQIVTQQQKYTNTSLEEET